MPLISMRTILLLILLITSTAFGQKYAERMIAVRDGEAIAADLYISDSTVKKPTILIQTPYNKNFFRIAVHLPQGGGVGLPYDSLQYNYVIADWRGFFGSKDAAKPGYDRGLDGYDLIEWIAAQSWSDGKVGTWGGSALGLIQFQTAKHQPPHLVCAMPFIINYKTEYENYFPGGVFLREHYEQVQSLGLLSTDLILQHPTYDNYWKIAENLTDYPDKINVPLLMLTGWYDHFPDAVIRGYESLRERSNSSVKDKHKLVIGPWLHTKVGAAEQGILSYPEAAGVPTDLAFQFFGFYLLGQETAWEGRPGVQYFDLGSHTWHTADNWNSEVKATQMRKIYLANNNALVEEPLSSIGTVTYNYDPRDPSPSIGSSTFNDTLLHGPQDIGSSIETRNDIAIFSTEALGEDLVIRGTIKVHLQVATDNGRDSADTDFGVRLCDVYPDGRSIIVSDAMQRMRFRNGYETEELAVSGTTYSLQIDLRNLAITIAKGHKLRIDLTSSNFPRFDLNTNTGDALYRPGDTLVAHTTLHLGGATPSYIEIPVAGSLGVGSIAERTHTIIENPCGDEIKLKLTSKTNGQTPWELNDAIGRTVGKGTVFIDQGTTSISIPMNGLPDGAYYLRFSGHKPEVLGVIKKFRP